MVPLCSTTWRGEYRRIIPLNRGLANHSITSRTLSWNELIIDSHCPQLGCCHLADWSCTTRMVNPWNNRSKYRADVDSIRFQCNATQCELQAAVNAVSDVQQAVFSNRRMSLKREGAGGEEGSFRE